MRDLTVIEHSPLTESALGGGLEGAERTNRETALWSPAMGSPDRIINRVKTLADARGRDMENNDGYVRGAVGIAKDSIVGGHYLLNAAPVTAVLSKMHKGLDDVWAEEFQEVAEARFDLTAESEDAFLDAGGQLTVTDMARMAVGSDMVGGEFFAAAEWLARDRSRPCKTAFQVIARARVSNPDGMQDDEFLRGGVVKDARGAPQGYWVRKAHPGDYWSSKEYEWVFVPVKKPWGRKQMLHSYSMNEPDQSRGISDMVSVLQNMRMTKKFDELTLQKAVVDASYAASLESELPPDVVFAAMGGNTGAENFQNGLGAYMAMLAEFFGAAGNIAVDGVKMPVLPPGVKMNTRNLGTPGGIGSDFGKSLLRHSAAALGVSSEEFMNNFSESNYSGIKGSVAFTERRMAARKKRTADRAANFAYTLWLEEDWGAGNLPMPKGVDREIFYTPLFKQALCKATWIGAGAGQIDEMKETQAAILRIKSGLSTYEIEIGKLGGDYRKRFAQAAREQKLISQNQLEFDLGATKGGKNDAKNTMQADKKPKTKKVAA